MENQGQVENSPLPFDRKDLWIAGGIFLIALLVYVRTLAPDVLFGDSGEFQILAVTGGLSHATGYPVYLLIAKLFTFIPIGTIAARVSFVSAFFASIALALLYLLARSLKVRRIFSAIAAGALLLSPLYWSQSIIAEVYTISAAFFAGFLLCAVVWNQTRDGRLLAAGGLLGGLCLGLHHTVVLSLPFVLVYVLLAKANKQDWKYVAMGAFAGIALSFAAYMVEGSINSAPTSTNYLHPYASQWGMKSSDEFDAPLRRVKFIFLAEQFDGDVQARHIAINAPRIAKEITTDYGWIIPLLCVVGSVALFANKRTKEGILLVGPFLLLMVFSLALFAFDVDVEFIQPFLLMCLLAAIGLQAIQNALAKGRSLQQGFYAISGVAGLLIAIGGAGSVILGAMPAVWTGKASFLTGIRRSFPFPVDYPLQPHIVAENVVSAVPDGSMLLLDWRYTYATYYVAELEDNKPGIDIVVGYPDNPPTDADAQFAMAFYVAAAHNRPLYADTVVPEMNQVFKSIPAVTDPVTHKVYLYRLILRNP